MQLSVAAEYMWTSAKKVRYRVTARVRVRVTFGGRVRARFSVRVNPSIPKLEYMWTRAKELPILSCIHGYMYGYMWDGDLW